MPSRPELQSPRSGRADVPAACLVDATRRFGDVVALDSVSLEVQPGRVTAVLGPNGAGKTTAVHSMLGAKSLSSGRAELFGREPRDPRSRMRVGALMQTSKVPETLRVHEHIRLFSSYYPQPLPQDDVVQMAGLQGLEERPYGKLSGGEQRRVAFALALCGDPEMLFLDEPTVGMDVESRRAFWDCVRRLAEGGRTILLTTHYLEEADALADRIVVLNHGRIVADGTATSIKARVLARRIRCRSRLSTAEIEALEGVDLVRGDRGGYEIFSGSPERVVRALLEKDPGLTELEVNSAALEDAFVALTAQAVPTSNGDAIHGGAA